MGTVRYMLGLASLGKYLYAAGGQGGPLNITVLATAERYASRDSAEQFLHILY